MNEELRWAYAAGLVDGEGCISIRRCCYSAKKRPGVARYSVAISVAMNDPEGVGELADLWGRDLRRQTSKVKGNKRTYTSSVYLTNVTKCSEVARILTRMLPYLRAKRGQALIVLDACAAIQAHYHKHYVPAETLALMEKLYLACKSLKFLNASIITHDSAA